MQQSVGQRPLTAPAVLGLVLIVVGGVALVTRAAGVNLFETIGPWGWPLFIIVPGLVLLAASVIPSRPNGLGFAVAGSIVTTVGLLLLYQWETEHWESWAYAWALLPAAAGLAQVFYGTFAGDRAMVSRGLWMAAIAGLLFAIGAWFFEGIFAGEPRPQGVDWWPIALIVLGGVIAARALTGSRGPEAPTPGGTQPPAPTPSGPQPADMGRPV